VQQQQRYFGRLERVDELERRRPGRPQLVEQRHRLPVKGVWVSAITAFHTAYLNVTIQNVPHQNEFFSHPDATYRDQPSKLKFVVGNA
jgi:hypothetical protein